jgi:hypothetical protein
MWLSRIQPGFDCVGEFVLLYKTAGGRLVAKKKHLILKSIRARQAMVRKICEVKEGWEQQAVSILRPQGTPQK